MSSDTHSPPLGSVLVVGGCGFLGSHLVRELCDDPTAGPVYVFSRNPSTNRVPHVFYHSGDITSEKDVRILLEAIQPRVIFHVASPDPFVDPPNHDQYEKVNVFGTANLLACATEAASVEVFIYTSSVTAVMNNKNGECFMADEESRLLQGPVTKNRPYHRSKGVADAMVRSANNDKVASANTHASGCLRTACIRITALYGEGDENIILPGIEMAKLGLGRFQLGDNNTFFDPVYVGNAVYAHLLAARGLLRGLEDSLAPKVDGEAFNITDDNPGPFWNYMWKVYAAAGYPQSSDKVWVIPTWLCLALASLTEWFFWIMFRGQRRPKILVRSKLEHLCMTRTYNVEKAKQRLGWSARTSVDDAVKSSVRWGLEKYEGSK